MLLRMHSILGRSGKDAGRQRRAFPFDGSIARTSCCNPFDQRHAGLGSYYSASEFLRQPLTATTVDNEERRGVIAGAVVRSPLQPV